MRPLPLGSAISADALSSPRWLVTNGETTVGPVHTELLLRGYLGGRIPEHCQVREVRWGAWRPLDGIREIGGLKRRLARDTQRPSSLREAAQALPATRDAGELLSIALALAALALDACAGLVHRYRSPVNLPVTSVVLGAPTERLGEILPLTDPSYMLALRGKGLCGPPYPGTVEGMLAERLQYDGPLSSVAMTPVMVSGRLIALLELGRIHHPFRADDADDLAAFAAKVASLLETPRSADLLS